MAPLHKGLPDKFKIIMMIRSHELRYKLRNRIIIIFSLLNFLEAFELSDKTQDLLRRYFAFLTDSCQDIKILNKRAKWLFEYSGIIQDHLLVFQDKYDRKDNLVVSLDNDDLLDQIDRLVDAVSLYRIRLQGSYEIDLDVVETLCFIIEQSIYIDREQNSIDYVEIHDTVKDLSDHIEYRNICGIMNPQDQEFILVQTLSDIKNLIIRFLMRNRPSLQM